MSHRKPSKTDFQDDYRVEALCPVVVQADPDLKTAWDNIFVDWNAPYEADPKANIAKTICAGCPVRRECLADALSDNAAEGIRAGFRFENGNVSREDARLIFKEFSLRARVKKVSAVSNVEEGDEAESLSEVFEEM